MSRNQERTAVETMQMNERLKAWSTVVTNLGSILFATAVARWYALGSDPWAVIWFAMSIMVIWSGTYLLTALELEHADG